MSSTNFQFPGSVGFLVAVVFLVTELVLLPLFEQARERLTTTYLRNRVVKGDRIWLHRENKMTQWFGLSDGVYTPGRVLVLLRCLKMLVKFSLLAFCFIFEFNIDSVHVTTKVTYNFNGGGASVMAPIPVEGLRSVDLHALVPFGGIQANASRFYNVSRKQGLDLDFSSMCTSTKRNHNSIERIVYFGIYTEHDSKLVCLNGTEGREKRTIMSFNPNSTQTDHSNITSIELLRTIARDAVSILFDANIVLEDSLDVHRGSIAVTLRSHYIKDVPWSMYGLVLHSKRKTVMRLNIPILPKKRKLCNRETGEATNLLGLWKRNGTTITCPDRITVHDTSSFLFSLLPSSKGSDIADVSLRIGESNDFVFGNPLDVMRAWMGETIFYAFKAPIQFTYELNDKISSDLFYFSRAKKKKLVFQTGAPISRATVKRLPTVALFISVAALLLYSIISFIVEFRSRTMTGISSNILTREACLTMLHDETSIRGQPYTRKIRLPIALMSDSFHGTRLTVDRREMTSNITSDFPS